MRFSLIMYLAVHARQKDIRSGSVTVTTTTASTPPPPLHSWAPPADAQPFARLADLVARTGAATEAECATLCAATPREKRIARGAEVATPRVAGDALRIFGRAYLFLQGAPKELVATVRLSPHVVRIGAWAALEAERRDDATRTQRADKRARRASAADVAQAAEKAAATQAAQLTDTLYNVAADDAHAATRIEKAAHPAAEGHTETSRGRVLAALVTEGRALLASKDPGVAARCALFQLDKPYLDRCAAAAERARAASRTADAPAVADGRSHADVDLWDGTALVIADMVVAAFGKAHAIDARVPKLAYVSLRDRSGDKGRGAASKKPASDPTKPASDPAKPDA